MPEETKRACGCGREHRVSRDAFGGARLSGARRDILCALESMVAAFTVDELVSAVRARRPGAGVATVYRAVASLETNGYLEAVGSKGGSALYTRCDESGHHHHLVCTGCGTVARTDCPIDESALSSAIEAGFTVTAHEVTVYGLCRRCSDAEGAR